MILRFVTFTLFFGLCLCATTPKTSTTSTTTAASTSAKSGSSSSPAPSSRLPDPRLLAPWTAAIFQRNPQNKDEWNFLCSGTITGRYTVITSARCVMPRVLGPKLSSRPHHIPYSDIQVVAGLLRTNLISKDQHTQFGTVGQIRDVYDANTSGDTPEGDLAAIRLKNQLNLGTPYVKAVQLLEKSGTLQEAKETKSGETLIIAGYDKQRDSGVMTRSQSQTQTDGNLLKIQEVVMEDTGACIEKYTSAYPTFYFNALCGKVSRKAEIIPCHMEGAGLVKKVIDPSGMELHYLFGVYSSNTALAKTEGTLVEKNKLTPAACTSSDVIFFTRYGQLGRWASSNNFCDHDLAMCNDNRCRPWGDLCDAKVDCDDGSDENEKMCGGQNKNCGGVKDKFRCKYGACIDSKLTCDGVRDCKDGSDEDVNGICKGRPITATPGANSTSSTCEGIKAQQKVTAHCSHPDRKGTIPCENPVPVGTQAVLRTKEIIVNCQRDGKWSRSTRLTC